MIYGLRHTDEFSLDYHESQSSVTWCTLAQAIPNTIQSLTIETIEFFRSIGGGTEPRDKWQDWQLEDLQRFLQDKSFERVYRVTLAHYSDRSKEYVDVEAVAKHGWEVIAGRKTKGFYKLENAGRFGNIGT